MKSRWEKKRVISLRSQPPALAWSPDGRYLATGFFDITLWNTATAKEIRTMKGHSYTIRSVSFSKDGKLLASASLDKTVRIWDVEKGTVLRTLEPRGFARYWQGKAITDRIKGPDARRRIFAGCEIHSYRRSRPTDPTVGKSKRGI